MDKENEEMVDKKKKTLIRWLIRINLVVFCIMLFLLILIIYDKVKNRKITGEEIETSETSVDSRINDSMVYLYQSLFSGWSFKLNEETVFSFGKDGNYSGFFDNAHKSVVGYSYEITSDPETGDYLLNIYNEDKSSVVSYVLTLDEVSNDIMLTYPGAENALVLSKEQASVITN